MSWTPSFYRQWCAHAHTCNRWDHWSRSSGCGFDNGCSIHRWCGLSECLSFSSPPPEDDALWRSRITTCPSNGLFLSPSNDSHSLGFMSWVPLGLTWPWGICLFNPSYATCCSLSTSDSSSKIPAIRSRQACMWGEISGSFWSWVGSHLVGREEEWD
jgi:hypothetical protein